MPAHYSGTSFAKQFGAWAVVAGGSDGIGGAFAKDAAARGLNVAIIARRAEPLEKLANRIASEYAVETLTIQADLTSQDMVAQIASATDDLDVGLFVHNAGSSLHSAGFLDQSVEDANFLIDLSCRAPTLLAHHFGTRLRARGRGGMIFMSSLACLAGNGLQATYAATKAFDTTFAEGLWIELAPEGVDVMGVLAGATRTETMLDQKASKFEDAMDPTLVAQGAFDHLGKGPNWVPGDDNQAAAKGLWPIPRVAVVNAMSQATAALFDLPMKPVEGREFHEND